MAIKSTSLSTIYMTAVHHYVPFAAYYPHGKKLVITTESPPLSHQGEMTSDDDIVLIMEARIIWSKCLNTKDCCLRIIIA